MCNEEGIYVSNYCQQNGLDQCALMITSFPGKQFIIILLLKLEPVKYIRWNILSFLQLFDIQVLSFLVVQKSFNMTGLLIKQIESLGMRINIAFVGDKLMKTVNYLETQSDAIRSGSKSYLLFHYKPSKLTSLYKYTSIKFEFCDHTDHHHSTQPSLYQNTSFFNANCLYNQNKFAKVTISSYFDIIFIW